MARESEAATVWSGFCLNRPQYDCVRHKSAADGARRTPTIRNRLHGHQSRVLGAPAIDTIGTSKNDMRRHQSARSAQIRFRKAFNEIEELFSRSAASCIP